ncbi:hypothetical protein [Pseudonocardia sp. EC080619-01]|uniref:hypothetical protein n=1 Tax=Pseudonocardia sp. EC080619-01 TaxID=1096856 RepID=UPI001875027A|nr:hypothetical protein [Pseudonocardia sp. EC080619-01]
MGVGDGPLRAVRSAVLLEVVDPGQFIHRPPAPVVSDTSHREGGGRHGDRRLEDEEAELSVEGPVVEGEQCFGGRWGAGWSEYPEARCANEPDVRVGEVGAGGSTGSPTLTEGVRDRGLTALGVLDVTERGLVLRETAPGVDPGDVRRATAADIHDCETT